MLKISRICSSLTHKHIYECLRIIHKSSQKITTLTSTNFVRYCSQNGTNTIEPELMQEITQGDAEREHKLKILILEADVLRQEGDMVPSFESMKAYHWNELLSKTSVTSRKKYLNFLFKVEMKRQHELEKKKAKAEERKSVVVPEPEEGQIVYNLSNNNILLRVYDTTINQLYNNKLIQAMQFSQKIVFDCGYDQNMTRRENINCAKQLMLCFAENRAHDEPFDMHYCNCNPDSILMQFLQRHIPNIYEDYFPLNVHQQSYLDVFDKNQLVYLSPHCNEELVEYNHDAVYIIGAIVDKSNDDHLSLARAKKEGLRMAKLPFDRFLQWGSGSGKSLTLNQVLNIMLDMRHNGDWKHALRHIPKRKLMDHSNNQNRDMLSKLDDKPFKRRQFEYIQKEYKPAPRSQYIQEEYKPSTRSTWKPKKQEDSRVINIKKIMTD